MATSAARITEQEVAAVETLLAALGMPREVVLGEGDADETREAYHARTVKNSRAWLARLLAERYESGFAEMKAKLAEVLAETDAMRAATDYMTTRTRAMIVETDAMRAETASMKAWMKAEVEVMKEEFARIKPAAQPA